MAAKYRVGVIASGRIARLHGLGWTACDRTEIVALADRHPEARASYAEEFGVGSLYADYREMMAKEELDIVSVCSWDILHAEMTIAAAAHKPRLILSEKPMAVSLGEGEAMMMACERNGVKLAISHQRRFFSAWIEARRLVQAGAIGKPERLWTGVGAGMMNTGTHGIDFQFWVLGDPAANWVMGAVERQTDRHIFGHRVEDCCAGLIGYEGGAVGVIENDLGAEYQVGARVYGSEGMMFVNDNSLRHLTPGSEWQTFQTTEDVDLEYGGAYHAQANGICDWLDGELDDYRGEARYACKTLEVMMGDDESARTHRKVSLPLATRVNPLDLAVEEGTLPVAYPGPWDERAFLLRDEDILQHGESSRE